jgi:hypothetical protein
MPPSLQVLLPPYEFARHLKNETGREGEPRSLPGKLSKVDADNSASGIDQGPAGVALHQGNARCEDLIGGGAATQLNAVHQSHNVTVYDRLAEHLIVTEGHNKRARLPAG